MMKMSEHVPAKYRIAGASTSLMPIHNQFCGFSLAEIFVLRIGCPDQLIVMLVLRR